MPPAPPPEAPLWKRGAGMVAGALSGDLGYESGTPVAQTPAVKTTAGLENVTTPGKRTLGALQLANVAADATAPIVGPAALDAGAAIEAAPTLGKAAIAAVKSPMVQGLGEGYVAGKAAEKGTQALGASPEVQQEATSLAQMTPMLAHAVAGGHYEALPSEPLPRAEALFRSIVYNHTGTVLPDEMTLEQFNAAHRAAVINLHPDVNPAHIEVMQNLNQATDVLRQSGKFQPAPPPPAPRQPGEPPLALPGAPPPMHSISMEEIAEIGDKIAKLPVEQRPQATMAAHTTLATELLNQGKLTIDGKIEIVRNQKQAETLAQRLINEEIGRQDAQAKKASSEPTPPLPPGFVIDEGPQETKFAKDDRVVLEEGDHGTVKHVGNVMRVVLDKGGKATVPQHKWSTVRLESANGQQATPEPNAQGEPLSAPVAAGAAGTAAAPGNTAAGTPGGLSDQHLPAGDHPAVLSDSGRNADRVVGPTETDRGSVGERAQSGPVEKPAQEKAVEQTAKADEAKGQIIFARHGETKLDQAGANETVAGWTQEPLDHRGQTSAAKLAAQIKEQKPTVIVTSDLPRAKQTADIVGKLLNIPVKEDARLRPQHVPETEGLKVGEATPIWNDYEKNPEKQPKDGETWNQARQRQDAALKDVEALAAKGEKPVVVTHSRNLEMELGEKPKPGGFITRSGREEGGANEPAKVESANGNDRRLPEPDRAKGAETPAAVLPRGGEGGEPTAAAAGGQSDRVPVGAATGSVRTGGAEGEHNGTVGQPAGDQNLPKAGEPAQVAKTAEAAPQEKPAQSLEKPEVWFGMGDRVTAKVNGREMGGVIAGVSFPSGYTVRTDDGQRRRLNKELVSAPAKKVESENVQPHPAGTGPDTRASAPVANAGAETAAAETPKYKFGSTQANIPAGSDAAKALDAARARISDADLAGKGKEVGDGGNHVTVRYGIKGEDTAGVKKFLSQQAPFEATLGKTEKFKVSEHTEGTAPIIAPIEAPELHRLNAELEKHGDFAEPSFKEYKPHATVAYVDPAKADRYVGMTVTEGKKFTVSEIAISHKDGSMETVKLEGKKRESWRAKSAAPGPLVVKNLKGETVKTIPDELPAKPTPPANVLSGNLGLHVIQFPSGKWGFVGSVPNDLGYEQKDGSPATPEQVSNIKQFGAGFVSGVRKRGWDTKEQAIAEAARLGHKPLNAEKPIDKGSLDLINGGTAPAAPQTKISLEAELKEASNETLVAHVRQIKAALDSPGIPENAKSALTKDLARVEKEQAYREKHPFTFRGQSVGPAKETAAPEPKGATIEPATEHEPQSNQAAGTARGAEEVSGVSNAPIEGGTARTGVSAEGSRDAEGVGETGRSAGQPDRGRLEQSDRPAGEGSKPARSRGSSPAKHPSAERTAGGASPTGTRGADGRKLEAPTPEQSEEAHATAAELRNQRNFHISDEFAEAIGKGGEKTKLNANLDALETLKKIQAEGREIATPDEQKVLAQYIDFGGLVGMLERPWDYPEQTKRFNTILTPAEIQEIKETLPNTHHTSMQMVDWAWKAMQRLGFKGGRWMEPGMGIGNMIGRMPEKISQRSEVYGVERNPLTGSMAKLLYPDAKIQVKPFQHFTVPNNSFDAAVGNVPFQDVTINDDPAYRDLKLNLHNYFIVKTLDKLKPGGIAALITSRYTLDSGKGAGYRAREEMAKRADLLAAIRLPNTAFKGHARTEVVADLLIFQKRDPNTPLEKMPDWTAVVPHEVGSQTYTLNKYIVDNPSHVLGEHSDKGSMYRENEYTVKPPTDFTEALSKAMDLLPRNVFGKKTAITQSEMPPPTLEPQGIEFAPEDVKPGAFFRDAKGAIKIKESGVGKDLPEAMRTKAAQEHLGAAIDLRDQVSRTIALQLQTSDDEPLKAAQEQLAKLYKSYVKKYGNLHAPQLAKLFKHDPEYGRLLALENVDTESKEITKAAIFTKRVLAPYEPLRDLPDEPKSAMLKVMAERGFLDTALMGELLKKPEADVVKDLEKEGLIFQDPQSGLHHPADEYLSGNVREKLKLAEQARETDPKFERNVEALKKVQPKPLSIHEIQPNLGQTWIPMKIYKSFVAHLAGQRHIDVNISRDTTGRWLVQVDGNKFNLQHKWAGGGVDGHKLVQYALNQQQPSIYDTVDDKRVFNAPATTAAREKLAMIKEEFTTVLRKAPQAIVDELEQGYNDTFNGHKLREFSGEHLDFPGMSQEWQKMIRGYQKAAVWRLLQEGRGGIFHAPGLGKTLTMAATGMEARRLKLSRKNMYAVPNHMIPQWREDFKRFYPNANVLAVTDDDFTPVNRAQLMSRIATGDWDAVIVPHSQFDLLPMSPQWESISIDRRLADYREVLSQLDENQDKRTIKQMEKAVDKLESRLQELNAKKKDNTISFDQMGVDMLFVDEAHLYKSMAVPTKMGNIGGISNSASQRAFALEMKANYLRDTHKGRGLVFGTGTPITNTVGELYVMTKYLAPEMLEKAGIRSFDDWAANFAQTVTQWEYAPDGVTFKPKTTLSEFVNVPELSTMFRRYAEYLSKEAARALSNLKEPHTKREDHMVTVTPAQEPLLDMVAERGDHLTKNPPKTREERMEDNWLKLSGDARKISLDARLYDPHLSDDPGSKANQAVRVIKDILDRSQEEKGTVAVFSDFFQHKTPDGKVDFNIFEDMKQKLVSQGVPASEVAIIHEVGDDKDAKELLFARVRSGKVRVIFGSTDKMGIGTNIQARLKGELHLDQPWRPDQVEQREGRIVRSGNMWNDVEIHRFIAEPREGTVKRYDEDAEVPGAVILKAGEHRPVGYPSVIQLNDGERLALHKAFDISEEDAKKAVADGKLNDLLAVKTRGGEVEKPRPRAYDLQMYQQLARKANFQEQFLTGNYNGRSMEDVGGDVKLNSQMFALGKAMATGNPDALRKMKVEHDLRTYSMLERNFQVERSKTQREQANAEFRIPLIEQTIKKFGRDIATWKEATKGEDEKDYPGLKVVVGDKTYQGENLKPWLDSNPPISSLVGVPISIGGLPTELDSRESMVLNDKRKLYEKTTKFEYRLAGENHDVPYDQEKETTHVRSLINSFASRARNLNARLENAEYDLHQTEEKLANLSEDLKRTSPYTAKVEGMEKELAEINKRLGIKGPADVDEGAAPSEEPEAAPKAKADKPENLITGESGEARPGELLKAAAEVAGTIGNYVRDAARDTELARKLQRGLQTLDTTAEAAALRAKDTFEDLKKQGLTHAADEAIYHHFEDPEHVKLDARQDDFFDDAALPLDEQNTEWFKELTDGGVPIENYVSRSVKGKAGMLDRIARKVGGVGKSGTLSKSAPQTKTRTMMAIESPDGDRRVVSIKAGKATMWVDGKDTELGDVKNAKGRSSVENETFPDGEPNSVFYDKGKIVEGPDGYDWKVTQATTKEIEASTDLEYYHSAFASLLASNLQLGKAVRALRFLNAYKASPEFKEIAWNGTGSPPKGWKTTTLPQFRGYYFEPRTAEVLSDYADRLEKGHSGVLETAQRFLRAAYLINPIVHPTNVAISWSFEKGLTGFAPWKWKRIYQTGNRAIQAVLTKNEDYKQALEAGAALQSHREDLQDVHKEFFDRLSEGLEKKEPWAMKLAEALGVEHGNLLNLLHKPSSMAAWFSSDIMYLQAAYQYQGDHPGVSLADAFNEVGRIIPEYRLPSRIMDSRTAAKAMGNPLISWFGAYHYGLLRSFGESARSALGLGKPAPGRTKAEETGKAWDRLAMLGLITMVLFPLIFDKEAQKATGNKEARFRRPGPAGYVDAATQVAEGKQDVSSALQKVVTPSPLTKGAVELGFNRELFSGHQIYDPHAGWNTELQQLGHYVLGDLGQYGQHEHAETTAQKNKYWWQQAQVQFGKSRAEKVAGDIAAGKVGTEAEDPADHKNRVERREILDQMRQKNLKPLEDAEHKHELTHKQVLNLQRRAKLDPLEDTVYNFTIPEVQRVLAAAREDKDAHEIKLLEKILAQKKLRARYSWQSPSPQQSELTTQ
jgi:N12 class adenine-specific DNA methylase/broad specificity phosphatase PhoE